MKLTFLGTGAAANPDREQCALAIETGGGTLLFDVTSGTGILRQLASANIDLATLTDVFLSHAHFDHAGGLPPLFLGLMDTTNNGVTVHGGKPTIDAVRCSIYDELPGVEDWMGKRLAWDVMEPGGVFQRPDGATIEAVPVDHSVPGMGYVVRDNGTACVISGDTRYSSTLADAADGCDILVHEAAAASALAEWLQLTGHSSPADAARVATEARVSQLVLTHIDRDFKYADTDPIEEARAIFPGDVSVAHDLLTINLNGRR
jgi:ribonuclease Z